MDTTNLVSALAPMLKQEIVKDDGRLLIYYTFPSEDTPQADGPPTQETPHV